MPKKCGGNISGGFRSMRGGGIYAPGHKGKGLYAPGYGRGSVKTGRGWLDKIKSFISKGKAAYEKVAPVHDFIRSNKLISKGAKLLGYDGVAKTASSFGYGKSKHKK